MSELVWRPELGLVRVNVFRGSHFDRMGRSLGGKLHLLPEEALYLISKGAAMLFDEQWELQALDTCYDILLNEEKTGVSFWDYQVILYCSVSV